MDFAFTLDQSENKKEKINKYLDLARELKKQNMKRFGKKTGTIGDQRTKLRSSRPQHSRSTRILRRVQETLVKKTKKKQPRVKTGMKILHRVNNKIYIQVSRK